MRIGDITLKQVGWFILMDSHVVMFTCFRYTFFVKQSQLQVAVIKITMYVHYPLRGFFFVGDPLSVSPEKYSKSAVVLPSILQPMSTD